MSNINGYNKSKNNTVQQTKPLLRHLFSPIKINSLQLPNRILMSSLHLNLDHLPDQYERMAHFYALRAKTNIGLIITSGCSPNIIGNSSEGGFSLHNNKLISKHAYITKEVHQMGGRIALQLLHFGRESFHGKLVSASAVKLKSNLFTPHPLTSGEIWQTIADYSASAERALEAGYDAIELIFSQGFLVHQFLANKTNQRKDEWGGSFENRSRFAVEIARTVRKVVGEKFPLIFRIPCFDLLENGLQIEETLALIKKIRPYGIDLLNISIGWHESTIPTIAMVVPRAGYNQVAAYMRQQFPDLKTAVSNRINDPRIAEQLLIDNIADIVAIGRPFLSDPYFAEKAYKNLFNEINTCIACNQSCLDYVFTGRPVGCSVNPDSGLLNEGFYPGLQKRIKVAVVGGGIAGMTAALFLAKRGAQVVLFEKADRLGGQLNLAAKIPGKEEFQETIRYYTKALHTYNVEIRCNCAFNENNLLNELWAHIIFATGAEPRKQINITGIDRTNVYNYVDILQEECPVTFPVVIIGGGGVACDIANYITEKANFYKEISRKFLNSIPEQFKIKYIGEQTEKCQSMITILQRSSKKLAHKIGRTTRWIVMQKLDKAGVKVHRSVDVSEITSEGVNIISRLDGKPYFFPAETVILATGQTPQVALIEKIRNKGISYFLVGAVTGEDNTNITTATTNAYNIAMAIA